LHFLFYLRRSKIYIPSIAKDQSGVYIHIEPVSSISVADTLGFEDVFRKLIAQGNPLISNRPRDNKDASPILKVAGVKTFTAFAQGALVWGVDELNGCYTILPYKKGKPRGWVPDRERKIEFPPETAVNEISDRLISMIQDANAA
jgi:hypothetical protein